MAMTPLPELLVKFGSRGERMQRLFENDETFREICENYAECAEALAHWSRSTGEDCRRVDDYRTTLAELEVEIEDYLSVSK